VSETRRVALMAFESHFCPSESAAGYLPKCDWLPDGFDGNEIGARCADVSTLPSRPPSNIRETSSRTIARGVGPGAHERRDKRELPLARAPEAGGTKMMKKRFLG
jgi:hypothetical protein